MGGVTLDLWDTIIADDSDEPRRAALGLPTKRAARLASIADALEAADQPRPLDEIEGAFDRVAAAFVRSWREDHVTFGVHERLARILQQLDAALSEGQHAATVTAIEEVECEPPPELVPGAAEGVRALAAAGPVVLISDTVITPGRGLRRILNHHGLLDAFYGFVFSDESGRSKPDLSVFQKAGELTELPLDALVHVGDRQHHDIAGAQAAGLKAVLFTAARDTDRPATTADAICDSWTALPSIIQNL